FDTGVSPDGMVENMRRLEVAPDTVEAVVCSHGHFDHTTGLDGLSRALGGSAYLPVLVHPEFWSRRRIALPGWEPWDLRTTDFERGFAVHQALRNGSWQPDPLVLDDQALVVHLAGRGLVVITGCGH